MINNECNTRDSSRSSEFIFVLFFVSNPFASENRLSLLSDNAIKYRYFSLNSYNFFNFLPDFFQYYTISSRLASSRLSSSIYSFITINQDLQALFTCDWVSSTLVLAFTITVARL
ncbi:hypothetical protein [Methanobrevibacter sp.]